MCAAREGGRGESMDWDEDPDLEDVATMGSADRDLLRGQCSSAASFRSVRAA